MNSCAERPARQLLDAAFVVLREETPSHHAALRDVLVALTITMEVRAELFAAAVVDGVVVARDATAKPDVAVTTSLRTAQRLLEGRCTLVEAIETGELDVRGNADALDAAANAFSLFLHGLVRAPSGPSLLAELNQHVATSGESS